MKKIRFQRTVVHNGRTYKEGTVAGFRDSVSNQFLLKGWATEAHPNARLLKYAPDQKVSLECVTPDIDDAMESAPKGATKEMETPKTNTKTKY